MKVRTCILLLLALFACALPNATRAAILFTEEYPTAYGDGTALGANQTMGGYSTKWPSGNSTGTGNPICTSAGALTYGPLAPISGASYGFRCPTAGSRDQSAAFPSQSGNGNSVYLSFLIQVTAATPVDRILIGFRNSTGGGTLVAAVGVNASRQLVLYKSGTAAAAVTTALTQNQTYLVVLRYKFLAAADECAMWLNPATGGADEASASVTPILTTSGSDSSGLLSLRIESDTDASGPLYLDELRVGSTWADVTPLGGPVTGEKLGFTTQPANTQTNATMNSIIVQVQSAGGASAASNGVPVTLSLTSGSGTLNGTLTQNTDSSGKATFSNLSINLAGTKQLTASASGIGVGLANGVSATFNITETPGGGGGGGGFAITHSQMTPGGFVTTGNSSGASVFTQILGSSDVGRAKTNWMIVSYQTSSPSAQVTFTNPVSPALKQVFYQLRTGDTVTKLEPPSIGVPPHSQIVSPGATAVFTVVAANPQLQYLWYFNGNPVANATNATLTIPNAQAGNVGNYHVVVANPAGTVTSAIATLGVGNVGPTITAQPQNQTINAGGTAIFNVAATGTAPLTYQWYFNNSTLLGGQTNSQLLLSGVPTNSVGNYRCLVGNGFGSLNSSNASLTVNPVPTDLPDTNVVGFAGAVTGGAGGTETTVSDYAALRAACRAVGPLIIRIQGTIVANEDYCYIDQPNKTIIGDGTNAMFFGDLRPSATNIIVQNLFISGTNHSQADGITIDENGHGTPAYIWVDHCTFYNCTDGSVDPTKGADFVTVSWCKFYYAPVPTGVVNHEFVHLIGSNESESQSTGKLHVTFHHNWYSDYCRERMPSVRHGRVHVFNNYYDCVGNNYCARTRINAQVLVENNYFLGVQNPWERFETSGTLGKLSATGNVTNNCTFVNGWVSGAVVIPGNDTLTDLSLTSGIYPYTLRPASDVPYYVQTYAGHGKYPYVP